ncbi:MAG: hypothetical protein AB1679_34865 [Actinomycetota bacterium]
MGRVLGLGLLLLVSAPVIPASAAESRGAVTQDGWWNRLQGPVEGEPEGNPIRSLAPAVPKPPTVPADAIAAGVTAGQVDKVAAVGLDLTLADGATLETLTLRLKESPAGGANVAADKAKVIACPATMPWGPGQNAAWQDRPAADCGLGAAEGARAEDGTWTFDLSAIGRLWADPFAPLAANGVVLSIDPASVPAGAQVSWVNFEAGGIALDLAATPGTPGPSAEPGPAAPAPVVTAAQAPAATGFSDSVAGTPALPAGVAGLSPDPFAYAAGQPASGFATPPTADLSQPGTVPEPPAEVTLAAPAASPGPALQARPAVDFWERLPAPTALLVPVTVGLAVLIGVALGPGGRPAPVLRREGGLSRALARRSGDAA